MHLIPKTKKMLLEPKISRAVFLLFIFFAVGVTWCAVARGEMAREENLFAHYPLGEEIRTGNLSFAVENFRRDTVGAGPFIPRPEHEFIVPTIILKNNSEKSFDFIPLLSLYVKDGSGNVYPVVAVPSEGSQLSGPLLPHDILREEVGFEVPSRASDLVLYFEAGGVERKIIPVRLEHKTFLQKFRIF